MAKTKKVPKRIAGVKLPKRLRRDLRELAATENGRIVLIEALATAAAGAKAVQAEPGAKPRKRAAKATRPTESKTAPAAEPATESPPPTPTAH